MADRNASRTALATAYLRAVHQLLDAPPLILEDPLAPVLLGPAAEQRLNSEKERLKSPAMGALRSHVVLRSRFAEDRLAAAVRRGVSQYVILGAGFDTFALRQPAWARGLRILEVDHAGTQASKRTHMAEAGLSMPQNAGFATIDFAQESLRDGLSRYQISGDQMTFFSWLGVTMYLQEEAIDAMLRSVASFAKGSEIVLTFAPPPGDSPSLLAQRAAGAGEPWVSYFTPATLEAKLRRAGFCEVEFLLPAQAEERYFRQRPDDLPPPTQTNILSAVL